MKSLINWEELRHVTRPPHFKNMTIEDQVSLWNGEAEFYDRIIRMELQGTLNTLDCIPFTKEDTVLEIGCGPGRITSQLVKRVKKVTALDISTEMMDKCIEKTRDYSNIKTILMDWNCTEPDINIPKHDIVISSRTTADQNIEKLCSFAKKYVVIIGWANAPSIPEVRGLLFNNTHTGKSHTQSFSINHDRRVQYNLLYNQVYDLGFEPNISIVNDGFEEYYPTKADAYENILRLTPDTKDIDMKIFEENVNRYLTYCNDKGYHFNIETRTFVMWWEINPKRFFDM